MSDGEVWSFTMTPDPPGVPLPLWSALWSAVGRAAQREGYELFFREADGLGRIHVRKAEGQT